MGRRLAPPYLLVSLPLHPLPAFGPEPRLVGRHRDAWTQLEHAVIALDELDVDAGVVEAMTSPDLGRKCQDSAPLKCEVMDSFHASQHSCITVEPQDGATRRRVAWRNP